MTGSSADIFRRGFGSSELLRGRDVEGRQPVFPADALFERISRSKWQTLLALSCSGEMWLASFG